MTYEDAAAEAQAKADATGADHGVAKNAFGYDVCRLPQKRNRRGRELGCEVRYCTDINRCLPGHGPYRADE